MTTNYSSLLSELIDKSGLSLTEISDRAEKNGQKITSSYLSKLKNGKMPPPSFKMSVALALSLEVEPELLLSAGIKDNTETNQEELEKTLQELYPNMDDKEIIKKASKITGTQFTETEQEIIEERDLSIEVLKEKYNLEIDGKPATDEEIEEMVKYIKYYRIKKEMEGS